MQQGYSPALDGCIDCEELLRVFLKDVPAGVAMFDRDMRYLQASDRWCADYSVDSSQVLGRSQYEVFPDIPERWKVIHCRGLQGETLRSDEDRWDRVDGTTWVRWKINPWKTRGGVLAGIVIFAENITRRKELEQALASVSRKFIEIQEQERTRIARDLHDDINQRLSLVAVEIDQLKQNPPASVVELRSQLSDVTEHLVDVCRAVGSISHQLHSPQLEYLGLVAAMKGFCREFAALQRVEVDFRNEDIPKCLPQEVSLCLFRILQEALHNAVRHSHARHFEVRVGYSKDHIDLIVADGGSGFDVQAAMNKGGLGLISMRERVLLVNGTIQVDSKSMGGTTIHARVPLFPAMPEHDQRQV
jgi:PAS domain S-box-containing protein